MLALFAFAALPAILLVMALRQRRGRGTYRLVVAAEFLFLVSLGLLSGGPALCAATLIVREAYGALFLIDYLFYDRMGAPLSVSVVQFAMRERENTRILIRDEVDWRDLAVLSAVAGSAALPCLAAGPPAASWASVMAVGSSLLLGVLTYKGRQLTGATNLLRILLASLFQSRPVDVAKERVPVERDPFPSVPSKASGCNVLLLIIESLCLHLLESPEGRAATPRYHAFLEEHARSVSRFPLAIANSTASDISLPTLFTGLSPERPLAAFQRQPLIWSAAKAAGHHTRFYTSQSLGWGGLSSMLLHSTLDHAVHRDSLGAPAVNDLAMDDRELNRIILTELPRADTPFFAIVNYNMLHYPFHDPGQRGKFHPGEPTERYMGALKLFDLCFGDLVDALSKAGRLEDTAILLTADHGELPESYSRRSRKGTGRRRTLRLFDLRPDLLTIPFWVYLPECLANDGRRNSLVKNTRELVSNLDIYPTILDLLGFSDPAGVELSGRSLLKEVPTLRSVVCLNTGALRDWEHEPFAVATGRRLWIYHDETRRFELVDPGDPDLTDLWSSAATPEKQKWISFARSIPTLNRILVRRGIATGTLRSTEEIAAEYDELALQGEGAELHQLDNWKLFSAAEWEALCLRTARLIGLHDGHSVFESGCGAGAFLDVLGRHFRIEAAGVDLSERLVAIACARVQGRFWAGDARSLSWIPDGTYDRVVSHGVFLYFPTLEVVEEAAREMVRIAKPGGVIYIGVLNDPDRLASYQAAHGMEPSGNYLVARDYWRAFAVRENLSLRILDQDQIFSKPSGYDAHSRLRYSVFLGKPEQGFT